MRLEAILAFWAWTTVIVATSTGLFVGGTPGSNQSICSGVGKLDHELQPAVTAPIVGATKPHHLEDAVGALAVDLSEEEVKALEEPYVPHPLVGFE